MSEQKALWVTCALCGNSITRHHVLHEKVDDDWAPHLKYHRLVECMGCDSIKYVTSTIDSSEPDSQESDLKVYPEVPNPLPRQSAITMFEEPLIPESVRKMYKETINALNAGSRTLAAGGLRAMVEGICLNNAIKGRNLQEKIDELAMQNLLTKTQAELLHEERYLGNAALHELATPSDQDLEDGLGIVEGLING
jgi:hypothetical protein